MKPAPKSDEILQLDGLPFLEGGFILVERALRSLVGSDTLCVASGEVDFGIHLAAWCRQRSCGFEEIGGGLYRVQRPQNFSVRVATAIAAGAIDNPVAAASESWGLAARGALVEPGISGFYFPLNRRDHVWTRRMAALYRRAAAAQWNPDTAIDWHQNVDNPPEIEDAIVQIMTYLIENETAALVIPARFAAQVHPHYAETMQLLAIQTADEARHIEIFTRRARLKRARLALSSAGGQASLKTLIDTGDFSEAMLLLSVLGEGSFLSLLHFLMSHAPDTLTRQVCALAAKDEARHIIFAMTHLTAAVDNDAALLARFATAIRRRHAELAKTAGLNDEVFYALTLLAAGTTDPAAIGRGYQAVQRLERSMHRARLRRLMQLGFGKSDAQALSEIHTRNFM